jgi:hypothetical protein
VNVDTGHLNVLRVEASELSCLSGLVVHAHLTDNLGNIDSHDEIGLGNSPNAEYLRALLDAGLEETATKLGTPAVAAMEIHNLLLPPVATPPPKLQVQRSIERISAEVSELDVQ